MHAQFVCLPNFILYLDIMSECSKRRKSIQITLDAEFENGRTHRCKNIIFGYLLLHGIRVIADRKHVVSRFYERAKMDLILRIYSSVLLLPSRDVSNVQFIGIFCSDRGYDSNRQMVTGRYLLKIYKFQVNLPLESLQSYN